MENQQATPQATSLMDRIIDIFASPSEAFSGIPELEKKSKLWIASFLATLLIGVFGMFLMTTNEALRDQMSQLQSDKIQEQVDQGRISQEQADRQIDAMEKMGSMFVVFGSIGIVLMTCVSFFGAALVLWLVSKFLFSSGYSYSTYLGIYGMAAWIGILGGIITMLMMLALGSFGATPSAALFVYPDFVASNKTHAFLARLDAFAIWQAIVIGFALSKVNGKSLGLGIGTALVLWGIWVGLQVALGSIF